jgi:hypothetical protein
MPNFLTTRELADLLGSETWRVRRLFEDGTLAEPPRFAGKRAVPREWIPEIVDALRARGWLPQPAPIEGEVSHDPEHVDARQILERNLSESPLLGRLLKLAQQREQLRRRGGATQ